MVLGLLTVFVSSSFAAMNLSSLVISVLWVGSEHMYRPTLRAQGLRGLITTYVCLFVLGTIKHFFPWLRAKSLLARKLYVRSPEFTKQHSVAAPVLGKEDGINAAVCYCFGTRVPKINYYKILIKSSLIFTEKWRKWQYEITRVVRSRDAWRRFL